MVPPCPWTVGAANPGSSAIGTSVAAAPSSSAAGRQPEPSTTATSCLSSPVRVASAAAASSASAAKFSVTAPTVAGPSAGDLERRRDRVEQRAAAGVLLVHRHGDRHDPQVVVEWQQVHERHPVQVAAARGEVGRLGLGPVGELLAGPAAGETL